MAEVKALLQYRASPGFVGRLHAEAPPWLEVVVVDETHREVFDTELPSVDVILHVLEPVTAEVIASAPALELVQKIGVGVNTIDLDAAARHGVGVANMPGTNTQAVAEHALGLTLAVLRRIVTIDAATRAGRGWRLDLDLLDDLGEIGGRTVGLVGYGAVGRRFAEILAAIGARVVYTATTPKHGAGPAEWRELPDLLAESDVVSLHVPLTPATERLLDAAAFASMRTGAVLVNTARGGLVDEAALLDALASGHLRGAGLDVFVDEPVDPGNPLLSLDRVVVAPHVAWLTPETLDRSMHVAFENCRRVRDGEPLLHEILPVARRR